MLRIAVSGHQPDGGAESPVFGAFSPAPTLSASCCRRRRGGAWAPAPQPPPPGPVATTQSELVSQCTCATSVDQDGGIYAKCGFNCHRHGS
jgi:hypothetical protein